MLSIASLSQLVGLAVLPSAPPKQPAAPLTTSIFSSFCARSTISPTSSAYLCSSSLSRSNRRKLASSVKETWRGEGEVRAGQHAINGANEMRKGSA